MSMEYKHALGVGMVKSPDRRKKGKKKGFVWHILR